MSQICALLCIVGILYSRNVYRWTFVLMGIMGVYVEVVL